MRRLTVAQTSINESQSNRSQTADDLHSNALTAFVTPADSITSRAQGSEARERSTGWWVAVLVMSILSMALRLCAIEHDSLWIDEAVTYSYNKRPVYDILFGRAYDPGNPPFYWILAGAWSTVFGDSEGGLRSLPALCGVLTVPFVAMVGRQLVSPSVGLLGALLQTISPTAIELSNEARPYSLTGLLAIVATWFFVRWVQNNRRLDLAFYSVAVFLVCSTHYYGGAVPLSHAASLAVVPQERRRLRAWVAAMAVAALLGFPVLRALVNQLAIRGNLSRMGEAWVTQFLATPAVFGLGRNLAWRDSPAWMLAAVSLAALVCFWLPALFALARYRRCPFPVLLLGALSLMPIVVPLIVALTLTPIYATRYAFVGLPSFLLLTAWGIEQFRPSVRRAFLLSILILTSMSLYRYATQPLKDDWRSETRFVLERMGPAELVAVEPEHEIATFLYYVRRYSDAPPKMVALVSGPRGGGRLSGMQYLQGRRLDQRPLDCTDSILSSSGVWLVLCASSENPELLVDYFARNGFALSEHRKSRRIETFHFTRAGAPIQSGGGPES